MTDIKDYDEFQDYVVTPTNGRPAVRFQGVLMGEASSWREGQYRWTELRAYKTPSDRWIVEQTGMTEVEGETIFKNVFMFNSDEELTNKFGYSRLGEKLWESLGFDTITIN